MQQRCARDRRSSPRRRRVRAGATLGDLKVKIVTQRNHAGTRVDAKGSALPWVEALPMSVFASDGRNAYLGRRAAELLELWSTESCNTGDTQVREVW